MFHRFYIPPPKKKLYNLIKIKTKHNPSVLYQLKYWIAV